MKNLVVRENDKIIIALKKLKKSGKKCLVVLDRNNTLLGTLSDGDLRKKILSTGDIKGNIKNIYNKKPYFIFKKDLKNKKKIFNTILRKKFDLVPLVEEENKKFVKAYFYENFIENNSKSRTKKINTPVIIMAGGKGTRLKPFTDILPKPLMPIHNNTVIEKIILNFETQGFNNFFITVNHKAEILKAYFKELNLRSKIKIIEEKKPLGTVGSLSMIKKVKSEFILTNCDNIYNFDYTSILKNHKEKHNDFTLTVAKKKIKVPYGVCNIQKGIFNNISEKPTHNFIVNAGMYVVNKSLLKFIKKNRRLDMDKFLHQLIMQKKRIGVFEIKDSQWHDTGQWNELKKTIAKYS
jgi:dTDP-glucose pyrophosphorylase